MLIQCGLFSFFEVDFRFFFFAKNQKSVPKVVAGNFCTWRYLLLPAFDDCENATKVRKTLLLAVL